MNFNDAALNAATTSIIYIVVAKDPDPAKWLAIAYDEDVIAKCGNVHKYLEREHNVVAHSCMLSLVNAENIVEARARAKESGLRYKPPAECIQEGYNKHRGVTPNNPLGSDNSPSNGKHLPLRQPALEFPQRLR